MLRTVICLLLTCLTMSGCTLATAPSAVSEELDIEQTWSGDYPLSALDRLPSGQSRQPVGWIGDQKSFATVWAAFMPGQPVPEINFSKKLIIYSRNTTFYNRTNIFKATLSEGVVEVLAMETMSARPLEDKAAMAMAVIPRVGVRRLKVSATTSIPVE